MLVTFIDPYLLAFPVEVGGPAVIERYVRTLLHLRDLHDFRWCRVFTTNKVEELVVSTTGFPPWGSIAGAIHEAGIEEIDAKEVLSIFIGLLQKLPFVEEQLNLKDVLIDNPRCIPDGHLVGRPSIFIMEHNRLLALMAMYASVKQLGVKDQLFATSNVVQTCIGTFSAELIEVEAVASETSLALPISLSDEFIFCSCPTPVREYVDPLYAWQTAENSREVRSALELFLDAYAKANGKQASDRRRFTLHSQFLQTVLSNKQLRNDATASKILRACAECIYRDNLASTHAIRVSSAANSPQRKRARDSATAWRRDIDRELHLHYWETASGPELASIVPHADIHIPE